MHAVDVVGGSRLSPGLKWTFLLCGTAPCWTADNGDCAAQWFTVRAPYRFPRFRPQEGRALATTRPRDGMGSARQREGGGGFRHAVVPHWRTAMPFLFIY